MTVEGIACLNLKEYSKIENLSEKQLFCVALQVASALDAIHGAGLYHLGVKGSNVLIDASKEEMKVFLTDTGLAHLFPPGVLLLSLLENCIKKMGAEADLSSFWESFYALAPEQKMGHSFAASDTYAFGVMLYRYLLGIYPEGRFPLPSEVKHDLNYNWDSLIVSCLQVDPAARPKMLLPEVEKLEGGGVLTSSFKLQIQPTEIHRPQFEPDPGAVFHTEQMVGRYQPQPQEIKSVEPIATKMSIIPGGSFSRGNNRSSRDESPRHVIHLSPFAMDIHPVTNEQYARFLEVMGGEKDGTNNDMIRLKESRIRRNGGKIHVESGYNKHPVVGVTWYGAVAYAKWVGKRLPTEAEWEVASYGGNEDALYPTGLDIERSEANFFSSDTTPVMSYPPNGYDLYDMAGNVYEWCNDWYDYGYYVVSVQEPDNPKGPAQGVYRVLRGGCWKSLKEDMRSSHRHRNNPGTVNSTYGFRCVADVTAS
jgi:formylglycine-generating enzyme required for sulfatase activity